jgi:hypothetical protein
MLFFKKPLWSEACLRPQTDQICELKQFFDGNADDDKRNREDQLRDELIRRLLLEWSDLRHHLHILRIFFYLFTMFSLP